MAATDTKVLEDMNITEAYYKLIKDFEDSYYLSLHINIIENVTKSFDDTESSEIYGYKSLQMQYQNKDELKINLNAFDDGRKICTYKNYTIFLNQVDKNTQTIIESTRLYPQDISEFIQNACDCNYFLGEPEYDEARQKEFDEQKARYCKPLPQAYKTLQEKYNNAPKMQEILKKAKANDLW